MATLVQPRARHVVVLVLPDEATGGAMGLLLGLRGAREAEVCGEG